MEEKIEKDILDEIELPDKSEQLRGTLRSAREYMKSLNFQISQAEFHNNPSLNLRPPGAPPLLRSSEKLNELKRDLQKDILKECIPHMDKLKPQSKEDLIAILGTGFDLTPETVSAEKQQYDKDHYLDMKQADFVEILETANQPQKDEAPQSLTDRYMKNFDFIFQKPTVEKEPTKEPEIDPPL